MNNVERLRKIKEELRTSLEEKVINNIYVDMLRDDAREIKRTLTEFKKISREYNNIVRKYANEDEGQYYNKDIIFNLYISRIEENDKLKLFEKLKEKGYKVKEYPNVVEVLKTINSNANKIFRKYGIKNEHYEFEDFEGFYNKFVDIGKLLVKIKRLSKGQVELKLDLKYFYYDDVRGSIVVTADKKQEKLLDEFRYEIEEKERSGKFLYKIDLNL